MLPRWHSPLSLYLTSIMQMVMFNSMVACAQSPLLMDGSLEKSLMQTDSIISLSGRRTNQLLSTMYEAHHTLGHIHHAAVKHAMKSRMVIGLDVDLKTEEKFCVAWAEVKLYRKPFPCETSNQSTTFDEHIFVDLWGLAAVLSISSV